MKTGLLQVSLLYFSMLVLPGAAQADMAKPHDLKWWNAYAVAHGTLAPQLKLENEKPKPVTIDYDTLIASWQ